MQPRRSWDRPDPSTACKHRACIHFCGEFPDLQHCVHLSCITYVAGFMQAPLNRACGFVMRNVLASVLQHVMQAEHELTGYQIGRRCQALYTVLLVCSGGCFWLACECFPQIQLLLMHKSPLEQASFVRVKVLIPPSAVCLLRQDWWLFLAYIAEKRHLPKRSYNHSPALM